MYQVLDILSTNLGQDFHRIKKDLYSIREDGFYVYAPRQDSMDDDIEQCVKYITRTSRPPLWLKTELSDMI